jgi:uncharacterized membrane protein
MSTSMGSLFGRHSLKPYSCSNSSMIFLIDTGSKISWRSLLMQRWFLFSLCSCLIYQAHSRVLNHKHQALNKIKMTAQNAKT